MIYLIFNIAAILVITFLNGMVSRKGERGPVAAATFGFAVSMSILAWSVFVLAHFVLKYW